MIKNYDELKAIKKEQGSLAIAFGCFDVLHHGHFAFIDNVLAITSSPLAVGVLPDNYVKATKGEERPYNNENMRLENLDSEGAQNYTFMVNKKGEFSTYKEKFAIFSNELLWEYPINALYEIKPTEFYYSTDFPITNEILAVFNELNIKHQPIAYTEGISSTTLIEKLKTKIIK